MTQANDLPARMNRAEDNIIDLRLAASALLQATDKNSEAIAGLIELSRRSIEGMAELRSNTAALQASGLRMEETIRSIQATNERMDRLFDYLIRRDQGTQA